jgi:hypothetical protein
MYKCQKCGREFPREYAIEFSFCCSHECGGLLEYFERLPPATPKDTTNPKDLIGMTKPPVGLVPPALIIHVSQAMKNGAIKYGPYNWRSNKVRMSIYLDAALRHILELLDGEDFASDSGVHHAAHAAACMGIILDALETGSLVDDRPKKGAAAKLIARFTSQKHVSHMEAAQPSNERSTS